MPVYRGGTCMVICYSIYTVNDYFVSNESLRLYADDTTEYASDPSPNSLAACC